MSFFKTGKTATKSAHAYAVIKSQTYELQSKVPSKNGIFLRTKSTVRGKTNHTLLLPFFLIVTKEQFFENKK